MTRVFTHNSSNAPAHDDTAVFATRPDGGRNFHEEWNVALGSRRGRADSQIICPKAVDDAALLKVIGRHLHPHTVSREDTDLVDAHPSSEVAEELVVLRFFGGDADAEGGIGEAFLYHAYELDHVLGH